MIKKMWLLRSGYLMLDQSMFTRTENGKKNKAPVYEVLLQTESGAYFLVDTGQNPFGISEPEKTWGTRHLELPPVLTEADDVCARLALLGLKPEDISAVINTHLHWDHTGGNQFFPHAKFYVQKAEYRFALYPDSFFGKSYLHNHFDMGCRYELLEGDYHLTDGVEIIETKGHTAGHQSVLVTMCDGQKVFIAGDACYIPENVEKLLLQGNCYDSDHAVRSLHKIRTILNLTGAYLLPSHNPSPDFMESLPAYIQVI